MDKKFYFRYIYFLSVVLTAILSLYFTTLLSRQVPASLEETILRVDGYVNWRWGFPFAYIKDNQYGSSLWYIGFSDDIIDYKLGVLNLFIFISLYLVLFEYIRYRFKKLGKFNFIRPKNIIFVSVLIFIFIDLFLLYGPAILFGSIGGRPFMIQEKIHDLFWLSLMSCLLLSIINTLYFFVFSRVLEKKAR